MQNLIGSIRTEDDLTEALGKSDELRNQAARIRVSNNIQFSPDWHLALDLKNMLDISEVVTKAALEQTESRGAHIREDHPGSDAECGKVNVIVRQNEQGINIT